MLSLSRIGVACTWVGLVAMGCTPSTDQQTLRDSGSVTDGDPLFGDMDSIEAGSQGQTQLSQYRVTGEVTGLQGSGLVLQNNGRDDLDIGSNGLFVFYTPAEVGTSYSITILTSPTLPSQLCTISHGAGTIVFGQYTTEIAIKCTNQHYTIGGKVEQLVGDGLTLRNNQTDETTIYGNGYFSFGDAIESGKLYAVSVHTEETHPPQVCQVYQGIGTVGSAAITNVLIRCELVQFDVEQDDMDGDGVPDIVDPFPSDLTKPGRSIANTIYPHSNTTLYTMDVKDFTIGEVGSFHGDTFSGNMTDLAINQFGVLFGITFGELFVCHPQTAECWFLASLPQTANGLTMVPPGTLDPELDTLIAVTGNGDWYRVTVVGEEATLEWLGSYGSGYTSSGDAYSILGVGTFAVVHFYGSDYLIKVNPLTGHKLKTITKFSTYTTYTSIWGLAGTEDRAFGFDSSGAIIDIDIASGETTVIAESNANYTWWGAGVVTRLDKQ